MTEKTLGQLACETFAARLDTPSGGVRDNLGASFSQYSALGKDAWEAAAQAVRNAVVEECAAIADKWEGVYRDAANESGDIMRLGKAEIFNILSKEIRSLSNPKEAGG